jgi:Tfp pilus assembly protein PilX
MDPTRVPRHPHRHERGATLIVALVAIVALLGIGMVTVLSVRSDTVAAGSDRFQTMALYAAESGVAAGMDFLRSNCPTTSAGFTSMLGTAPTGITGNNVQSGTGYPFTTGSKNYYSVSIKNNAGETSAAADSDYTVVLRSVGYAPNSTQVVLEVEVTSPSCLTNDCQSGYAQGFNNAANDNTAKCVASITASSLRSSTP